MCNEMLMDKKDLIEFFNQIKCNNDEDAITTCCEQHDVTRLDVDRMFRYIDKCFSGHPLNFAVKGSEKFALKFDANGMGLDLDNMPVDGGDVDDFIDLAADDDVSIDIDDTNLGTDGSSKCKNKSTTKNKSKTKPTKTKSKSNKVNYNL